MCTIKFFNVTIINDILKLFKVIIQSPIISRRISFNERKKNMKKTIK